MGLSFSTRIAAALSAGIALVFIECVTAYLTIDSFVEQARAEARAHRRASVAEQLLARFVYAEDWMKSYLASGSGDDELEYRRSTTRIAALTEELRSLVDHPRHLQPAADLQRAAADHVAFMDALVSRRARSSRPLVISAAEADAANASDRRIDALAQSVQREVVTFPSGRQATQYLGEARSEERRVGKECRL